MHNQHLDSFLYGFLCSIWVSMASQQQTLFYWKAWTVCFTMLCLSPNISYISQILFLQLWPESSVGADQPCTIRCHAGLHWCLPRICPASIVFILHTCTRTCRGWPVFKMYACLLIYTVRLIQHVSSHSVAHAASTGGERRISCQDTYLPR